MTEQRPGSRASDLVGGGIGVVLACLVGAAVLFVPPAGLLLVVGGAGGAFVLLSRDDPYGRAIGAGLLAGIATLALFAGACFAIISGIDAGLD